MIQLRLKTFDSKTGKQETAIRKGGEVLSTAIYRAIKDVPLDNQKAEDVFQVLVNGHLIESEFWHHTAIVEMDSVLIAPKLGDDAGSIFKTIITIAVTIAVSYATAGLGNVAAAAITAGATIATTLALNALIPPPAPEGLGGGGGSLSESQMYSITSQSNVPRKFQTVPKVYGAHRMFPIVAANPYVDTQLDPETKEEVQFLYAVYDFGFGPNHLSDFRIGDTPLSSYADIVLNIVDPLKPTVAEGPWDAQSRSTFQFYKRDNQVENLSVVLNGNRVDSDPVDTYELVRNAAENPELVEQEITITLLNPSGLYGYGTDGVFVDRSIELEIHFAEVGTSNWRGFNDEAYVSSWTSVGGDQQNDKFAVRALIIDESVINASAFPTGNAGITPYTVLQFSGQATVNPYLGTNTTEFYTGIAAGSKDLYLQYDPKIRVNSTIYFNGDFLGRVASLASYTVYGGVTYYKYTLYAGVPKDLILFYVQRDNYNGVYRVINGGYSYESGPYGSKEIVKENADFTYDFGASGEAIITRKVQRQAYSTFKFTPKKNGDYKVRINRVRTYSEYDYQTQDDLTVVSLRTRKDSTPIVTDKRHTFVEVKIRATNQLNGAIQNLSALCVSALDVYDPGTLTWSKQLTSNPAWVFCDLLTGEVNKRAVSKDRLDLDSIVEWADFCDEIPTEPSNRDPYRFARFSANFILDYAATLQEMINRVCSTAQSGFNIVDGNYGVLVDKNKTVPVQVFTPRNSKGFSSTRNYARIPNGVKVTYVDPNRLWQPSELVVYDDGFTALNSEQDEIDDLIAFACTNEEQAFRFGRYMLAQNRLRQETITIEVDFEYLVCTRGDYVQFTHDVMRVGGTPARVRTVVGNRITIDDSIETGVGTYGFVYRGIDGSIVTDTLTVVNSNTFDLDGSTFPENRDLIVIGLVNSIVYDCIVKSISTGDELSASLTLVEKADAVYDSESLSEFPEYDPNLNIVLGSEGGKPTVVRELTVTDSGYYCNEANTGYIYYADISWEAPEFGAVEHYEVHINNGLGYSLADNIGGTVFRYFVDQANLNVQHSFKIIGVSANGKKLNFVDVPEVVNTPMAKSTPPSNVERMVTDITNEVIQLSWDKIADCDVKEYLVRYSPDTSNVWENSIPLLKADKNLNLASTQARTGIYLIKAVDYAGNISVGAAAAITTVPNLFNLNVIESITDFPDPEGTLDRAVINSGDIRLQVKTPGGVGVFEYYDEGYYIYEDFLDLGEIYSVRLQAQIQAEGLTDEDIISNWDLLSEVISMANAGADDWDVEAQYRSTTAFNTISEWVSLDVIDPISSGDQDNFTEWRKFIMGDATGRIFQFRLKLVSTRPIVTPRVFEAVIKADMPDRLESYNDISAPDTGYSLTYTPAFKGPGTSPNIQVSIDGASTGDYWTISNKDLEGFDIQFFDKNDSAVARQFDAVIKGYGRKAVNII